METIGQQEYYRLQYPHVESEGWDYLEQEMHKENCAIGQGKLEQVDLL